MIDFSEAPEGVTSYIKGSDVINFARSVYDIKNRVSWIKGGEYTWGCCGEWLPATDFGSTLQSNLNQIPCSSLTVTCDNDRELMLCEQVLRMCRGEASEFKNDDRGEWSAKSGIGLNINSEYRAKPKKELVVPWEFISDCIDSIRVSKAGNVYGLRSDDDSFLTATHIKLDLTGIELPITVKRPGGK